MSSITYFFPDVNDITDRAQDQEDAWECEPDPDYVPAAFARLVSQSVETEHAADLVNGPLVADDGLPVSEPVDVADDDELVWIWSGMYEEVA